MRKPVAHELEPIGRLIRQLIVFPSDVLQQLEEMQSAARIDRRHRPVRLAVLEPGSAGRGPREPLHQLVRVVVQVLDGAGFDVEGFDVFGLEFGDHLEGVARVPFEDGEDGRVGCGTVGANEH